jgi:hypothetical protein
MEGTADMELLFVLVFFVVITTAGARGWVADSRDYADWQPTDDGMRLSPRG